MAWKPDYCTVAELKDYLSIPADDTVDDAKLAVAITASSRAIDDWSNRQFGQFAAPMSRFYTAQYRFNECQWVIEIDDLMTVTGLTVTDVAGNAVTSDNYKLYPRNAVQDGKPWTRMVVTSGSYRNGEVEVVARYGWNAVPSSVKNACMLQASRLYMRKDAPFGVIGSPDQGSELRLLSRLDADVVVLLQGYYRWWGMV